MTPKGFLIFTCVFYFVFGVLMIHPINLGSPELGESTYGKLDRHILRVWRMARRDANQPFSEVKDHALYHKRSPGLFKFIAEITARMGATTPIPLQIALIFLVILGIIAQYTWLKEYFKNDIFPVVSVLFVLGSHWLTYFGITIHQHPYNFAFFNFCMLFIVRYIHTKNPKYFILTWLCYLFLCQSYYMFWISTFIMMVGIQYFAGTKIVSVKNFVLGLAPVITVISLILQLSHAHGSFENAVDTLKYAAKARIADEVHAGKGFQKKMNKKDWVKYPLTVSSRIERYFFIPGIVFLLLGFILHRLRRRNQSQLNYKFFYFLVPAGLSWYFFMFQHTAVHQVAGRYSFFLWMIFFGYFFTEIHTYIQRNFPDRSLQKWIKYSWIFILIYGVYGFGFLNFSKLVMNSIRYVQYKIDVRDANEGDTTKQLAIMSNKFVYDYGYYNKNWLTSLTQDGRILDTNLIFHRFVNIKFDGYVLLERVGSVSGKGKLIVNGKKIKLEYPNEPIIKWNRHQYIVLKLDGITQLDSIVYQK